MTIKHLVISGGGPLGLRYLGALEKLEKESFWKLDNIKSIYGTSIGAIIGAFICLNYDWDTLNKYIIELHTFETVEFSHTTHPDFSLLQVLTMSSALPGIFMPTIIDNKCYVDGGVMCNYPLNQCLRDNTNKDEILGIRSSFNKDTDHFTNVEVTTESSLLEYIMCLTINSMNYIRDSVKMDNIENTVRCYISENPLTLEFIQESVRSQDLRRQWIQIGEEDAIQLLQNR